MSSVGSQRHTFVKVCGITRLGDAREAVRAGADAIGFVFAKSPRRIPVSRARSISEHLHPSVRRIGVFVDASLESLLKVTEEVGLDGVQLQGGETTEFVRDLKRGRPALFLSKVIRTTGPPSMPDVEAFADADVVMLDPKDVREPLESRQSIQASWLAGVDAGNLILSGGLNSGNVGNLVRSLRPFGVDVSSGVEFEPGRKDPSKIRAFLREVRRADRSV